MARNFVSRTLQRFPTYVAKVRRHPGWLPMFALARIEAFRNVAWRYASPPQELDVSQSNFPDVDCEETVQNLRDKGLCLGINLPPKLIREIGDFARRTPCFANFDRSKQFLAADHAQMEASWERPVLTGHFFETALDCSAVRLIRDDPMLLKVAQNYLGGEAHVSATRLWWSFPTKPANETDLHLAAQKLHFDLDDWRMLKFFFYIQDVDREAGPHHYIIGSHKAHALKHQLTLLVGHPAEEIEQIYGGEGAHVELTGRAGFGFAEDPFGFHSGSLAKSKRRLLLEIGFGVSHH